MDQFSITDSNIYNGIFHLQTHNSIWLFVEEKAITGVIPYNLLSGDLLLWQGQNAGRTDKLVINHERDGREVLVFYKRKKNEYPNSGLRYEGSFNYVTHSGNLPASFVLSRSAISPAVLNAQAQVEASDEFIPTNDQGEQNRVWASIARRRGQRDFRGSLLDAYAGKCAITGCELREVLEAAHIMPYRGPQTNHIQNGLLLRSDIHTLFDLRLLCINPADFSIVLSPQLLNSEYSSLSGKALSLPADAGKRPSLAALQIHRGLCGF